MNNSAKYSEWYEKNATNYSKWYELPKNDPYKREYSALFSFFTSTPTEDLFNTVAGIECFCDTSQLAFVMLDTHGEIHVLHHIEHFRTPLGFLRDPQEGLNVAMLNDVQDLSSYFVEFPARAFHRTKTLDCILTPLAIDDSVVWQPTAKQIAPNLSAPTDEFCVVQSCRFIMLIPPCVAGQVLEAATTQGLSPRDFWIHIAQPIYKDDSLRLACTPFIDWCRIAYAGGIGTANPLQMAMPTPLHLSPGLYQRRLNILRQDLPVRFEQRALIMSEVPPDLGGVPWDTLPGEIWLLHIFPFVGPGNHRFLGSVCLLFGYIYLGLFSITNTYDQVYTAGQARLCYQDLKDFYGHEAEDNCIVKTPTQLEIFCNLMARLGRQPVLEYLASQNCTFYPGTCAAAAEGGHFELLKWLHQQNCPWDAMTCNRATKYKDCKMLKWLHEHGCPWDEFTCYMASYYGNWNVLKYARRKGCPWGTFVCMYVASKGNLRLLKWVRSKGCPWDETTCSGAAGDGQFHILHWARSKGCPWNSSTCDCAAVSGHLDVVKWAFENGCDLGFSVFRTAAEGGQLEVLEWLHSINYPGERYAANLAVENGHLHVVKWLYSINCITLDECLCANSAKIGHLEMLQWLRLVGCPWNKMVCFEACKNSKWEILRWAHENGCPWDDNMSEVAGKHGIGPMAAKMAACCNFIFQNSK